MVVCKWRDLSQFESNLTPLILDITWFSSALTLLNEDMT